MATLTKSTGTVTLSGAAEKVTLPASYGWVWVKNMSDSDIFAGLSADISDGADGVMTIPAGECGRVQMDGSREFYLLGTGNALVVAQNYADCPFKVDGKGGEAPDLSAYAKKSDIPTELPANGGNADTIGGIQASDIRQITKNTIQTLPTPPTAEGDYFVSRADSTFPYPYGNLSIRYGSYTSEFVAMYQTRGDDQKMWFNVYRDGWSGWKEISTTPIKSTTVNGSTDGYGSLLLWSISGSIPIAAVGDVNRIFSPFIGGENNYYLAVRDLVGNAIANTTASATVFYI